MVLASLLLQNPNTAPVMKRVIMTYIHIYFDTTDSPFAENLLKNVVLKKVCSFKRSVILIGMQEAGAAPISTRAN
jgi:hypothetical protein